MFISQLYGMIKDKLFKTLCIPLLGVLIPLSSNLIRYQSLGSAEIIYSNIFFIAVSFCIWRGSVGIVSYARQLPALQQEIFLKLTALCFSTPLYGFSVCFLACSLWQIAFYKVVQLQAVFHTSLLCASIVIFLTLLYEVLFLSKERELDSKIVNQLAKERIDAELNSLKGELDPHFIFNSLTSLSHLISEDSNKAQMFTGKLTQVYKYLLINKDRELISLDDELRFINDYFFLLRIRYDNKIIMSVDIENTEKILVVPCSLQALVENAIKHNVFSEKDPLNVRIYVNGDYVKVENNVRKRQYAVASTRIGLSNLSNRYRLIYNRDIEVEKCETTFTVKLPLIKPNSL